MGTSFSYYRQEPGSPGDGPSARGWNQARRLVCMHLQGPERPQSTWGCTMQFLLKETWPTPDTTFNNQRVGEFTGRPQSSPLVPGGLRTGATEVPSCSIGAGRVGKPLTLAKNPTRLRELHRILLHLSAQSLWHTADTGAVSAGRVDGSVNGRMKKCPESQARFGRKHWEYLFTRLLPKGGRVGPSQTSLCTEIIWKACQNTDSCPTDECQTQKLWAGGPGV